MSDTDQEQYAMSAPARPSSPDELRWQALCQRDREAAFLYGVTTTGVYCRPGCTSRPPRRENVRYFENSHAAERAGFRPCRRCHPDDAAPSPHGDTVLCACRALDLAGERGDTPPSLGALAAEAGLSTSRFQRVFKAAMGITPKQYSMERRLAKARRNLDAGTSITDAVYEAGYSSSGRFYEEAREGLGMRPSAYRNGGQDAVIRFVVAPSYLGWALVAGTEVGLCAVEFGDSASELEAKLRARFPRADLRRDDADFAALARNTLAGIASPRTMPADLPLDIQGTAFQRRVWQALRAVPAGTTTSYGAVAAAIGQPKAVRAVAQACAANPVAVVVPCHRVRRATGELGGYRWGARRKATLLEVEERAGEDAASLEAK